MGVLAGVLVPKNRRKLVVSLAAATFVVTYLPLMAKFFSVVQAERSLQCVKQSKEE